jgi:hypothetical protein
MTKSELSSLREGLNNLTDSFNDFKVEISADIGAVKTLIETESMRCPYREQIARASNNVDRLSVVEERVTGLRIDSAKSGAAGGGVVAMITAMIFGVGKAAGWW